MVSFRLSQVVAKKMINQKSMEDNNRDTGSIINLSSIADRLILPESFAYSICAASVNQLTKSLAVTLADKGIRVNAIAMGSIMSTTLKEMIREDLDSHDQVKEATPLKRIGETSEAASAKDRAYRELRIKRDSLLSMTDFYANSDVTMPYNIKTYRQT